MPIATQNYEATTSGTGGITSLATASTFLAGYEWFTIDNTTVKAFETLVQGEVRVGTTPTISTEIRIYAVPSSDGTTWPDVIDGGTGAKTFTSAGIRDGTAILARSLLVDSTTSARDYPFQFALAPLFGGFLPKKVLIFVTHNTGVNLDSTAGNHSWVYSPIDITTP